MTISMILAVLILSYYFKGKMRTQARKDVYGLRTKYSDRTNMKVKYSDRK